MISSAFGFFAKKCCSQDRADYQLLHRETGCFKKFLNVYSSTVELLTVGANTVYLSGFIDTLLAVAFKLKNQPGIMGYSWWGLLSSASLMGPGAISSVYSHFALYANHDDDATIHADEPDDVMNDLTWWQKLFADFHFLSDISEKAEIPMFTILLVATVAMIDIQDNVKLALYLGTFLHGIFSAIPAYKTTIESFRRRNAHVNANNRNNADENDIENDIEQGLHRATDTDEESSRLVHSSII